MKKHKKPRFTEARNLRKQVFKYYRIDDKKRYAVPGGRCHKCNKITDAFCDKCNAWVCENHMVKADEYSCFCLSCGKK